jgi:hypothetical protein
MKKHIVISALALLLAGCGNNPPVPDWQMNAKNGIDRATAAYMEGNTRVEAAEFKRAREALASTGKVDLIIRAELTRCAARVASLVFGDCLDYDKLAPDASPADRAYAAYLAGRAGAADIALLPQQHQAAAAAVNDAAAASAVHAIADPLSKLVAAGAAFEAGKGSPPLVAEAVDTASAQGWRRPLLAWLGVQALLAEQAGDTAEVQRIRRRIALAGQPTT